MGMPGSEAGTFADLLKIAIHIPRVHRCADGSHEDETRVLPSRTEFLRFLRLALTMVLERRDHRRREVHCSATPSSLGVRGHQDAPFTLQLPPNLQYSAL